MTDLEDVFKVCDNEKDHHGLTLRNSYFEGYLNWFERYRNGDTSLDPNLKGMKDNNLTENEAFFILAYTGSCSSWINERLRDNLKLDTPCKQEFARLLDLALEKMPSYNNGVAYRMDNPSDEAKNILSWFISKKGKKFEVPNYLSTAKEDYNNSPIVWKINTLNINSYGKDISELTNNKYEEEILFKRNSKFIIDDTNIRTSYVYLTEIEQSNTVDFKLTGLYFLNI